MAFDAGSIEVRYGLTPDKRSLREYRDNLQDALGQAERAAGQSKRQKFGIGIDRGSFRKLDRALDGAHHRAKRVSRGINSAFKVGAAGLATLGVAATGAGVKMIQLASDAEEMESKFKIVFGKETDKAVKQLDKFSKATGASRYTLQGQAADLQALIKPMGLSEKAAAGMSVELTQLATDLSSFNNVPVEDALLAIRSGLVGESEPLRRFGVQLSAARVEAEALTQGLKVKYNELTAAQKAELAYSLILKDTTLAQGDAIRTSDGFANQLRRLQNAIKDTATEVGVSLLPTANKVVQSLNKMIQDARPALDRFSKRVGQIMEGPGSLQDKIGKIWKAFQDTGATEKIREILVKAIAAAAEGGVKTFIAIWNNTGIWGKLAIGTIIAAKLAPVATGFAKLLTGAIGGIAGGRMGRGGLGKAAAGAPIPVFVTNPGFGGAGAGGAGAAGGLSKGARLIRGLGVIGVGVTINETLNAFGLPNSRTVGRLLAEKLYGDADSVSRGDDRMLAAGRRIRNAGKDSYFRTQAGLNREVRGVWNQSDDRNRKRNVQNVLRNIALMERLGKVAKGSTKRAMESLGTSAQLLGIKLPKELSKVRNATGKMSRRATKDMDSVTASFVRAARFAGISADKIAAAARRASKAASGTAKKAFNAVSAMFAGGGYIAPRSGGVRVTVHGDEAILNAEQMALVGRDRVMAALAATGAPTLAGGGSYAKGAKPKKAKPKPKPKPKPVKKKAPPDSAPGSQSFLDRLYKLELAQTRAEGTPQKADDARAINALIKAYKSRASALARHARNPKLSRKRAPLAWRAIREEQNSVASTLNSLRGDLASLNEIDPLSLADTSLDMTMDDLRTEIALSTDPEQKRTLSSRLLDAVKRAIGELRGRLAGATGEARSAINGALQSLAGERDALTETQRATNPIVAFMSAREDLYSQFGSNARAGAVGMASAGARTEAARSTGGANVTQNITISQPPPDPHSFSKALAWNLRGAL